MRGPRTSGGGHDTPHDDGSTEVRGVLDAIRHIVRVLRVASRAAEKRVGLSGAQLFVLQALAEGHAVSLGELAERTFTDQSSVSVVVARLVGRGLVRRRRSSAPPPPPRRLELTLTPAGRAVAARAPAAVQGRLISGLERLRAEERRLLARTLGRLLAEMGVGEGPPAMFFEDEGARSRRQAGGKGRGSPAKG